MKAKKSGFGGPYPLQKRADCPGWQRARGIAPITARQLDTSGGSVIVDGSRCYMDSAKWHREVQWKSGELTVRDEVKLKAGRKNVVLFRWHLGTANDGKITGGGRSFAVCWADAHMKLEADAPLVVSQYEAPDATVKPMEDHQHTCIEVRSESAVGQMKLTTSVTSPVSGSK